MPLPDRRPSDTPRSYAALCDYCAMGPTRSIDKLVQVYTSSGIGTPPTRHRATLGVWSSAHAWVERAAAYDAAVEAAEEQQREKIRAERRKQVEELDWESGNALREATRAILSELPRFIRQSISRVERVDPLTKATTITEVITLALKAGPGELAKAMEIASKIQRLSVGEATEIHKLVETELGAMLDLLQSQLTPEEYARVVSVIAGGASA